MKFIDRTQVAEKLSIHPQAVYRYLRDDPTFPKPTAKMGRRHRWLESAIEAWMQEQLKKENYHESQRTQ